MFNKKPRRNFRQRKEDSSDEEDEQRSSGDAEKNEKASRVSVAQSRGISCSSKREATPSKPDSSDGEDGETLGLTEEIEEKKKDKAGIENKSTSILSFSDDKEGNCVTVAKVRATAGGNER